MSEHCGAALLVRSGKLILCALGTNVCCPCLQVVLPPALTGAITSNDPHIRSLQEQLNEVNRKILRNEMDLPPEHLRSPSPEPR